MWENFKGVLVGEPTPLEGVILGEPTRLGEAEIVDWKKLMAGIS